MLMEQLADKVNARGDTPAERLAAVENRMDEVATHGIRLGTTLGLAAMATHTGVDYSIQPRGFQGGAPEDIDEIEVILERLDGHGDAIAELTHPQSVLNRLFDYDCTRDAGSSAINKEFQFPCLCCDDSFVFATASLILLKRIRDLCLSRTRENKCPLAKTRRKSSIRKSISTIQ
jgi:hypothetical protein